MRQVSRSVAGKVAGWLSIESESGVTAIEYGLLASLVALAIIVGATLLGTNLGGLFTYIAGKVKAPTS
jgi:pilus assembly protein Flp/PilA